MKFESVRSISGEPPGYTASRKWLLHRLAFSRRGHLEVQAFSLLEMVVVLAIIGILVAIQLPNIIGNTDKAKLVAAMTHVSNIITECSNAKVNGASETQLMFGTGEDVGKYVPSLLADPDGYKVNRSDFLGCRFVMLQPVDSDGNLAEGKGFPTLFAKLAPGGKIIKAFNYCKKIGTIDFEKECKKWDYAFDSNYQTTRDLEDENWDIRPQ